MGNVGHIIQVVGPVVDVSFSANKAGDSIPGILHALEVTAGSGSSGKRFEAKTS